MRKEVIIAIVTTLVGGLLTHWMDSYLLADSTSALHDAMMVVIESLQDQLTECRNAEPACHN